MKKNSLIYVAGHKGLVGSALVRELRSKGYENLVFRASSELDLRNQAETERFFAENRPEYVFLAAARVGGIGANTVFRAEMIYNNIMIESNVIHSSWKFGVKKLLFLGSSCIYPKFAQQPMTENELLTSGLEYTNEPYAIAKIAGLKMCESYNIQYGTDFISVMPSNLYGENDSFNLQNGHVLPTMIRRFHEAKVNGLDAVELWGSGRPRREFLYSGDLAEAAVLLMEKASFSDLSKGMDEVRNTHVNIGSGEDISIYDLAFIIKDIVGYDGDIVWDTSKPDGTPRKLLDISKIKSFGWKPRTKLTDGIEHVYRWYVKNKGNRE
ncbi:GDP-L-fucose synthase [bacterium]|nr:GDP-L-fucose synthase [bacterium]